MHLIGIILFFGSLVALILWVVLVISQMLSKDTFIHINMGGNIHINIFPPLVLFVVMAISAGMAWGEYEDRYIK